MHTYRNCIKAPFMCKGKSQGHEGAIQIERHKSIWHVVKFFTLGLGFLTSKSLRFLFLAFEDILLLNGVCLKSQLILLSIMRETAANAA